MRSTAAHIQQCLWWLDPLLPYGVSSQALGCWKNERLVGGGLFRLMPVPLTRSCIVECKDGPIFQDWEPGWAEAFVSALIELSRHVNSMATIIQQCPREDVHTDLIEAFKRQGLNITLTPALYDVALPLGERSLADVWKGFNELTRRMIKKGRAGVMSVRHLSRTEDLRRAYAVWTATAQRKNFLSDLRPWAAIEPVLRHCIDQGVGAVLAGAAEEKIISAAFVSYVGKSARFVYGGYLDGSERHHPNHVLHYCAIQECLERGMVSYNFGPLISEDPNVPTGVDRFKFGFGALARRHLDAITWIRRPLLYRCVERLRRQRIGRRAAGFLRQRSIRHADAKRARDLGG